MSNAYFQLKCDWIDTGAYLYQKVVGEKAPCSACHDPHGVSNTQGNPLNNPYLINFDLTIVQPDRSGNLRFEKLGIYSGQCYPTWHGEEHKPEKYP